MLVLALCLLGLATFVGGTARLGWQLRQQPSKQNAERLSRIMHTLFFVGLGAPFLLSLFYPGVSALDPLVGLSPLPYRMICVALGILIALPGAYLFVVSNRLLRAMGSGANAYRLTQRIVANDIYQRTRNPMSLGYYLLALSIGLLSGSTLLTVAVLFGIIPAHLFFLKYFEECELDLRFGQAYTSYRQQVPFLFPKL